MTQTVITPTKIVMNDDYNVSFYNEYGDIVITIETAVYAEILGTSLIVGDSINQVRFDVNEIALISGPSFSQSYTPFQSGIFNQDEKYYTRLTSIYDYVSTNVVSNVLRVVRAVQFSDGTEITTAPSPSGSATWGDITGDILDQSDLQLEFDGKYDNPTGTTSEYVRGDGSLATFPTISSGLPHSIASGTDTYTATISGVISYVDGDAYLIRFTNGNTTTATLNINGIGAINLYRNNDGPLVPGDILDGAEMLCVYNSTTPSFQCIGTSPNTILSYVTNDDNITITKGQPVYASGGIGDRLKVKLAYNTSDTTSAQTIGLVFSTSIASGQKGIIIMQGLLTGLNILPTSTWADSDPVYLGSTAGSITPTKQYAPNHLVYLGFVTTASNGSAGRLYVRVQNGYEMDELHNVSAQTPSNNDGLFFNTSTSLWESKSIVTSLGYTPEDVANKKTSMSGNETSNTFYLSAKAIYDWAISIFQSTITGGATTITTSNLTASKALISNASGKVDVSTTTDTELGYVHGVTSPIQTQLDNITSGTVAQHLGGGASLTISGSNVYYTAPFYYAFQASTDTNTRFFFMQSTRCIRFGTYIAAITTATTLVKIYKNSVLQDTLTIALGSAAGYYHVDTTVDYAHGDYITMSVQGTLTQVRNVQMDIINT